MPDNPPRPELAELTAELAELTRELAAGAAEQVRDAPVEHLTIAAKSTDTDLVTEVDRATERWLVENLARRRPDDEVLGEEGGGRDGSSGVRWLLDPIDGTVNFVLGLPLYAVSVAAELDGVVVAGAVCNPQTRELYYACRGGGAFLDGRQLFGPRPVPLARAIVATGFGYDASVRRTQAEVAAHLLPLVGDIRRLGAAALDLCFLAAGRVDAYFEAGLHPWDHAAGGLIAAEAGCRRSGLRGADPSERFYAAAGPDLAAELFALLEELGADRVLDAGPDRR